MEVVPKNGNKLGRLLGVLTMNSNGPELGSKLGTNKSLEQSLDGSVIIQEEGGSLPGAKLGCIVNDGPGLGQVDGFTSGRIRAWTRAGGDGPELGHELGRPKARTQARNQASGNENEVVQLLLRLGTPLVVESTWQPSGEALAKFPFPFWAVAVQSATYPTGGALAKL